MNIVVAFVDEAVRGDLIACVNAAGLEVYETAASPQALQTVLDSVPTGIVVSGQHWPDVAPILRTGTERDTPVALLLDEAEIRSSHPAFRRGAAAIMPTSVSPRPLATALAAIAEGLMVLPRHRTDGRPPAIGPPLSAREREVLELVSSGMPTKQVARRLALSPNTVKHHMASVFRKLGVKTRAEAIGEAIRRGELTF